MTEFDKLLQLLRIPNVTRAKEGTDFLSLMALQKIPEWNKS